MLANELNAHVALCRDDDDDLAPSLVHPLSVALLIVLE